MSNNLEDILLEDSKSIANELEEFYDELEGKTVLIAGGKGFLGTYFTSVLTKINETLSKPMKIIVLDSLITSKDKKDDEKSENEENLEMEFKEKEKIFDPKKIYKDESSPTKL